MDLHLADALHVHPPALGQPTGTITAFGPLHTVEPSPAFEPRIPRFDTRFGGPHPSKKPRERLVKPAQRGLLTRQ